MVITRGDTIFLKIKYYDNNKVPIVIPEDGIIKFTVKDKIDGTKLFQKQVTSQDYDIENRCYNVIIRPEDTSGVDLKGEDKVDYYYDFQLSYMQDELEVIKTMSKGKFTIKYDITTD